MTSEQVKGVDEFMRAAIVDSIIPPDGSPPYTKEGVIVEIMHGDEAEAQGKVYHARAWCDQQTHDENPDEANLQVIGWMKGCAPEDESGDDDDGMDEIE